MPGRDHENKIENIENNMCRTSLESFEEDEDIGDERTGTFDASHEKHLKFESHNTRSKKRTKNLKL